MSCLLFTGPEVLNTKVPDSREQTTTQDKVMSILNITQIIMNNGHVILLST